VRGRADEDVRPHVSGGRSRGRLLPRGPSCSAQMIAVVFGGDFLALPVHAGGALVIDLHTVHANVALPCFRITRDHTG